MKPWREIAVGDWYSFCCEIDLYQATDEAYVKDVIEDAESEIEDLGSTDLHVFATCEEGLAYYLPMNAVDGK